MSNVIPRYSEGNKVEFSDKVSIWLNRAAGFFSKDTKPVTPSDFAASAREYAILLTWTPDSKADFYNVYASSTNDVNAKVLVGRLYGDVSSFIHYIGSAATRYYWLEANTNTGRVGELVQTSGTSTGLSGAGASPTAVRVYRSTTQTISNATSTAISFDTEVYDHGNLWAIGNPTRLVAPVNGIYLVTVGIEWVANATGTRFLFFKKNGTTDLGPSHGQIGVATNDNQNRQVNSTQVKLAATDYVEVIVNQGSGGNLNLNSSADFFPLATMALLTTY